MNQRAFPRSGRSLPQGLAIALLALGTAAATAQTASTAQRPVQSADGLEAVNVPRLDAAWVRPGVDLSRYGKVFIEPASVQFSGGWKPEVGGRQARPEQIEDVRRGLERGAMRGLDHAFRKTDRVELVSAAGAGVLRLKPVLTEVYLNAPDFAVPATTRSYARSVGRMTVAIDAFDGATGELVGRFQRTREDPERFWLERVSSVDNSGFAQEATDFVADVVRDYLTRMPARGG